MWTLGEKYGVLTPAIAAKELMALLKTYDPFLYKRSVNRSSYYIHFRALPNGLTHKLRVSNHEERDHYGYKWQLRLDGRRNANQKPGRFYFDTVDALARNFQNYYRKVEELNAELMAAGGDYDERIDG